MDNYVATFTEHEGYPGDEPISEMWKPNISCPEGYKFVNEFVHQKVDIHIHVGLYELIPPPLPTVEKAAIEHIKQSGLFGYEGRYDETTYKKLYEAVQRKLNADE